MAIINLVIENTYLSIIYLVVRNVLLLIFHQSSPNKLALVVSNAVSFTLVWTTLFAFDYWSGLYRFPVWLSFGVITISDLLSGGFQEKLRGKFVYQEESITLSKIAENEYLRSWAFLILMFCLIAILGIIFWGSVFVANI